MNTPPVNTDIYYNSIYNNITYGIEAATNTLQEEIDANNNYWGSVHRPLDIIGTVEMPGNPATPVANMKNTIPADKLGNAVSEKVDYYKWQGKNNPNASGGGIWAGGYVNPTSGDLFAGFDTLASDGVAIRMAAGPGTARGAMEIHGALLSRSLRSGRYKLYYVVRSEATEGMGCVRFDFTRLGESEREFSGTDFSSNLEDVLGPAAFMRRELGPPRLLVGHSLGGAAMLAAAARVPEAELVVPIAAPSGTEHFRDKLEVRMAPDLEVRGEAEVTLGGRRFHIRRQLLDDLAEHALEEAIASLGKALIVCHSPADTTVDITQGERIFALARHPKSFLCLEGADHLLLADERDARLVVNFHSRPQRQGVSFSCSQHIQLLISRQAE